LKELTAALAYQVLLLVIMAGIFHLAITNSYLLCELFVYVTHDSAHARYEAIPKVHTFG